MSDPAKLFWRQSGPSFTNKQGIFVEKPKALIHLCVHEGCTKWGAFSVGARWKDGIPGTWYCREHLPVNEVSTSQQQDVPVASTAETSDANRPDGTGDLFAGPNVEP